jgi:hypothetical protein
MKLHSVLKSLSRSFSGDSSFESSSEMEPPVLFSLSKAGELILNTNLHLGPFLCLVVELYYNNFPFPKRHFWVAVFYGTFYLLINLGIFDYNLVYSLSVKVIYEPIDWKSVLSYCIVVGSYFITFGAHHFGGFAYRKWKAHKIVNRIHEGLIEEI